MVGGRFKGWKEENASRECNRNCEEEATSENDRDKSEENERTRQQERLINGGCGLS